MQDIFSKQHIDEFSIREIENMNQIFFDCFNDKPGYCYQFSGDKTIGWVEVHGTNLYQDKSKKIIPSEKSFYLDFPRILFNCWAENLTWNISSYQNKHRIKLVIKNKEYSGINKTIQSAFLNLFRNIIDSKLEEERPTITKLPEYYPNYTLELKSINNNNYIIKEFIKGSPCSEYNTNFKYYSITPNSIESLESDIKNIIVLDKDKKLKYEGSFNFIEGDYHIFYIIDDPPIEHLIFSGGHAHGLLSGLVINSSNLYLRDYSKYLNNYRGKDIFI